MSSENLNIDDIMGLLDQVKEESIYEVKCVGGKKIKFYPMSSEDQKTLLTVLVDSPVYNNKFNTTIYSILAKTYIGLESFWDLNLTIIDRDLILLTSRAENVGDTYTFKDDAGEEHKISLKKHINSLKVTPAKPITVKDSGIEVSMDYPTIKEDYEIETAIASHIDRLSQIKGNQAEIKDVISTLFILNILKFVKTIKIKETVVNFSTLSVTEKVAISQKLNSILIKKLAEEIDNRFSKTLEEIKTIKYGDSVDPKTYSLTLDNSFFLS